MSLQLAEKISANTMAQPHFGLTVVPAMERLCRLGSEYQDEVLAFLALRPVHTVVMTSFINDNGLVSELNRGTFYGYFDNAGELEGVALIGHHTLIETKSDEALKAFALAARESEIPVKLIMSDDATAQMFWQYFSGGTREPRLVCNELLFEISFPVMVRDHVEDLRTANADELLPIAEAHAEVAFLESGVNPMERDREGFLQRTLRRIEQGRTYVLFQDGKLVFKADVVAETEEAAYLEGIYVAAEMRGKGIGADCLSQLSRMLLTRVKHVCLLSNTDFSHAHQAYRKAGFKSQDSCTTIFV